MRVVCAMAPQWPSTSFNNAATRRWRPMACAATAEWWTTAVFVAGTIGATSLHAYCSHCGLREGTPTTSWQRPHTPSSGASLPGLCLRLMLAWLIRWPMHGLHFFVAVMRAQAGCRFGNSHQQVLISQCDDSDVRADAPAYWCALVLLPRLPMGVCAVTSTCRHCHICILPP